MVRRLHAVPSDHPDTSSPARHPRAAPLLA